MLTPCFVLLASLAAWGSSQDADTPRLFEAGTAAPARTRPVFIDADHHARSAHRPLRWTDLDPTSVVAFEYHVPCSLGVSTPKSLPVRDTVYKSSTCLRTYGTTGDVHSATGDLRRDAARIVLGARLRGDASSYPRHCHGCPASPQTDPRAGPAHAGYTLGRPLASRSRHYRGRAIAAGEREDGPVRAAPAPAVRCSTGPLASRDCGQPPSVREQAGTRTSSLFLAHGDCKPDSSAWSVFLWRCSPKAGDAGDRRRRSGFR